MAVSAIDGAVKHAVGGGSTVYQALSALRNDTLAPGGNHFAVKTLNDLRAGDPGENAEITQAADAINHVLGGVEKTIGALSRF